MWAEKYFNLSRLEDIHKNVKVNSRYLAVPVQKLEQMSSFAERNNAYIDCAVDIGERAIREALTKAELTPRDIDHLFFVTVTGLATPSIDARLVNRLGLRPDVKRTPIFGLGCVAGAAGMARAADYLRAFPDADGGAALRGAVLADAAARGSLRPQHHRLRPVRRRRRGGGAAAAPAGGARPGSPRGGHAARCSTRTPSA